MCPLCQAPDAKIIKKGFFTKRCGRPDRIQRFLCKRCGRKFSSQTLHMTYREKKPHLDQQVFRLLTIGVSQRGAAYALGVDPKTVARKLDRLGARARLRQRQMLASIAVGPCVVFDEMETFEHSKCKPLSIAVAVEEKTRRILCAEVASMPAKGRLAAIARRKYGFRPDRRSSALRTLCRVVRQASPGIKTVKSDECPRYPSILRKELPGVKHQRHKGLRGCVVGQGELKASGRDPLFDLNHSCAMFRDNLKRLSRRTWCTTKRPDRLQSLMDLYIWHHNERRRGVRRLVTIW